MDKPKFILNPNAAPFIPNFKRAPELDFKEENMVANVMLCDPSTYEKTEVHEAFDSRWQPNSNTAEKLLISVEDSPQMDYQIPETKDHVCRCETMEFKKQDLEDSSQIESEYLSSLFPNFSLESVNGVYRACRDVVEARFMLEQLEGHDDSSHSLPDYLHFSGASSSGHNDISSDLVSQPDFEAVEQANSANIDFA